MKLALARTLAALLLACPNPRLDPLHLMPAPQATHSVPVHKTRLVSPALRIPSAIRVHLAMQVEALTSAAVRQAVPAHPPNSQSIVMQDLPDVLATPVTFLLLHTML